MKAQFHNHKKRLFRVSKLILVSSIILSFFSYTSQEKGKVTGTLNDKNGPIIGASIQVLGTSKGTYTYDGTYSLELAVGSYDLIYSMMGYITDTVSVYIQANKTVNVNVVLKADAVLLQSVVVTGYTTVKAEDVTGGQVMYESTPFTGVDQAVQGKAAGVTVTSNSGSPGQGMNIVVGGLGTTGNERPLWIVDGKVVGYEFKGDPNKIKDLTILKDAGAMSQYGARGANGVIVVDTKNRGNKKLEYVPVEKEIIPEPEIPANNEDYDLIFENIDKDTKVSPISTFSIDVDRASYANVRRFINQSQKPSRDAVRLEEMINYFEYEYPQPQDKTPFSINIESQECTWDKKKDLVLIGLQGEKINTEDVPATNLVFLIDVSGSMSSYNKLGLLKQSFGELVNKLRPQDKVSIVVYAGAAGVVLNPTSGAKKEQILNSLNNLQAGGSTAGGAGIELAYKLAKENFVHGGNNRVILATDGDFNVGASSDSEMVRLIESKRDDGIFLSILGFGMGNYKDAKMEQLSNAGNGNYAYVDNLKEAQKIFGVELWGTLYTIAKDVKIQVEFNPAIVASYRLIGYENRMLATEDFENDKKDAGEIGSGHTVTALYEITYTEKPVQSENSTYSTKTYNNTSDLMTVNVRYKEPDGTKSKLITQTVQKGKMAQTSNIQFASCVAEFGLLLRDSKYKGTASYGHVLSTARSLQGEDANGYKKEFVGLVQKAKAMY